MSIPARPFMDPRNTYIVDNNDPSAFDKSFAGIPGTHPEQRCCGDRAPYWQTFSGPALDRPEAFYWRRLPDGGYEELWCNKCSTILEDARDDLQIALEQIAPALRAIAIVASYMPGIGTAVSVIINTSVTLAEGSSINEAAVTALRGALPGQPASGMVFDAARSIVKGDSISEAAIDGLLGQIPDLTIRDYVHTAMDIARDVIDGQRIDRAALDEFQQKLPNSAKGLMDVARSLVEGRDVQEIAIRAADGASGVTGAGSVEAALALRNKAIEARNKGQAAVEQFLAEVAFHGMLSNRLVPEAYRQAVVAGLITGRSEKEQIIAPFPTVPETSVAVNDKFFEIGQRIIQSGAEYKGILIADILKGHPFTVDIDWFDALNSAWSKKTITFEANGPWTSGHASAAWRRGFTIALAVCDGFFERDPHQTEVYQTMAEVGGRAGFDAGQAVQFHRTLVAAAMVKAKLSQRPGYVEEKAEQRDRILRAKIAKIEH